MKSDLTKLLACIALCVALPARAQTTEELSAQDLRLARIADAMLIANAGMCRQTMPVTGMVLHSIDQYGESAPAVFDDGPLAIAEIVPGSAADIAGLRPGDTVQSINGTPVTSLSPEGEDHIREAAFFLLADMESGAGLVISVKRDDEAFDTEIAAPRGCRSLVEILVADGPNARSDGRVIQLQYSFAASLDDSQMAVVLAHELAHTVLEHRRRKEAEGIDNATILRHVGRNQHVNRKAEVEADRLSVHLVANTGYDPAIIVNFWNSPEGIEAGGGAMPSFIYPSQSARAELIAREIAMFLPMRRGPSWPGHLIELRDRPLSED